MALLNQFTCAGSSFNADLYIANTTGPNRQEKSVFDRVAHPARNAFALRMLEAVAIIPLALYAVLSLSLAVLYGPGFYFYIRKFYNQSTKAFLVHILIIEGILWVIILLQAFADIAFERWLYNLFYIGILLWYGIRIFSLRRSLPLKRGEAWMKTIALGFAGLIVLYGAQSVWMSLDFENVEAIVKVSAIVFGGYCLVFLFLTLRQIVTRPSNFSTMRIRIPYRKAHSGDYTSELQLILDYVQNQFAFKQPELSRELIAQYTGISVNRISEVINAEYKKNFNDWINDYRIETAKKLIAITELSIKEIYFEVGFNSKSAFNSAFKKRLGQTPSAYRKNVRP